MSVSGWMDGWMVVGIIGIIGEEGESFSLFLGDVMMWDADWLSYMERDG